MCGGAGWGSENVVGDWGGGHFMVNGNGDRKVPGSAKLPVAF